MCFLGATLTLRPTLRTLPRPARLCLTSACASVVCKRVRAAPRCEPTDPGDETIDECTNPPPYASLSADPGGGEEHSECAKEPRVTTPKQRRSRHPKKGVVTKGAKTRRCLALARRTAVLLASHAGPHLSSPRSSHQGPAAAQYHPTRELLEEGEAQARRIGQGEARARSPRLASLGALLRKACKLCVL